MIFHNTKRSLFIKYTFEFSSNIDTKEIKFSMFGDENITNYLVKENVETSIQYKLWLKIINHLNIFSQTKIYIGNNAPLLIEQKDDNNILRFAIAHLLV